MFVEGASKGACSFIFARLFCSFGRFTPWWGDGAGSHAVVVGGGDAGAYCLYAAVVGQASGREGRGAAVIPLDGNPQVFLGIDVVGVGFCALGLCCWDATARRTGRLLWLVVARWRCFCF